MNIAIIDVGSNNIKLEIHDVDHSGNCRLVAAEKVNPRLGSGVFLTGRLSDESIGKATEGLKQFSSLIKTFHCKKVIALGTAALREADHAAFVKKCQKETGIAISVISGLEEARLIYSGVLAHTPFEGRCFFLIDIGGGSTEISVATEDRILFSESLRLGTVRLKEYFEKENKKNYHKLVENYVREQLKPFIKTILRHKIDLGLATGGTVQNLLEIMQNQSTDRPEEENGLPVLTADKLKKLLQKLKGMTPKELAEIKGLDPSRQDIIIPGAILLQVILEEVGIKRSLVSPRGLRDGALVDYIYHKINRKFFSERQNHYREHAIEMVGRKYQLDLKRARHCTNLAIMLFDGLQDEHQIAAEYRDILFGAAFLHDVGIFIDYSQHHKHSYYLILNSEISGFSSHEKNLIAQIARYHRKNFPKPSHTDFFKLEETDQKLVLKLAAILRIANSLDRSHKGVIKKVQVASSTDKEIALAISGKGDISLELWSVERAKAFFEKVFGKNLKIVPKM